MISYQIERFGEIIDELKVHIPAHWEEMATKGRECDVDWEGYLDLDRSKRLVVATAREEGRLAGYIGMKVGNDMHSRNRNIAEAAFYFIEHRPMRGLVERNMLRFITKRLTEIGIGVRIRTKIAHSSGKILENIGFQPEEILYIYRGG